MGWRGPGPSSCSAGAGRVLYGSGNSALGQRHGRDRTGRGHSQPGGGDTAGWAGDSPAEGQSIAEWEGQSRAERGRTDSRGVGRAERGRIDSSGAGRPSSRAGSEGSAPPHVPRALAGRSGQWGSGAGPAESRESGALRAGGTMLRAVAAQRLRRAVSAGRARRAPGTERGLPAPGRAGPAPGAEGARRGARGPAPPARQPWSGVAER